MDRVRVLAGRAAFHGAIRRRQLDRVDRPDEVAAQELDWHAEECPGLADPTTIHRDRLTHRLIQSLDSLRRHVRIQSRRRRRGHDGRRDRPGGGLGRDPGRPQGRQAGVRGHRPREGPAGDRGAARRPGEEGEDHPGAGRRAARGDPRPHHGHHRLRRASATSTSSSRPCPSGWRSSRRCSPSSTRPRPATRSSPPTPRRCRSPRWARRRCRPDKVVRLPLLLPRLDDAADRGDRGRRHLRGDAPGRRELRPGDPQDGRSAAARCPASSSTASSTRRRPRSGA